jgi:putative peptidoglycan lipid II flippase
MIAATLVTFASLPVYSALFSAMSVTGLAIASDIGIAANTVVLAVLLHRRKLVPLSGLPWGELAKVAATAIVAGVLASQVAGIIPLQANRMSSVQSLALASLTWAGAVAAGLWLTKSSLISDLRRRRAPVATGEELAGEPAAGAAAAEQIGTRLEP